MGILEFEDHVEKWIENHPFKWVGLLIFISYFLAFIAVFLFGISKLQGFIMGSIYSFLLIILEMFIRSEHKRGY